MYGMQIGKLTNFMETKFKFGLCLPKIAFTLCSSSVCSWYMFFNKHNGFHSAVLVYEDFSLYLILIPGLGEPLECLNCK